MYVYIYTTIYIYTYKCVQYYIVPHRIVTHSHVQYRVVVYLADHTSCYCIVLRCIATLVVRYNVVPCRVILPRSAPYRNIRRVLYCSAPCRAARHRSAPRRTAPYRTVPYRTRTVPHRTAPCRAVPYHCFNFSSFSVSLRSCGACVWVRFKRPSWGFIQSQTRDSREVERATCELQTFITVTVWFEQSIAPKGHDCPDNQGNHQGNP